MTKFYPFSGIAATSTRRKTLFRAVLAPMTKLSSGALKTARCTCGTQWVAPSSPAWLDTRPWRTSCNKTKHLFYFFGFYKFISSVWIYSYNKNKTFILFFCFYNFISLVWIYAFIWFVFCLTGHVRHEPLKLDFILCTIFFLFHCHYFYFYYYYYFDYFYYYYYYFDY